MIVKPLLVFDLDGTLADTAGDLIATLNVVLAREGLAPVPAADARPMLGAGARALIQRGLASSGQVATPERLDAMFADFLVYYLDHIADESVLFPGVEAALDRFEAAGWAFAICTNKMQRHAARLMSELGVAHRFRAICGQDSFPTMKPHRDALLGAIAQSVGDPSRSLMVGDSKTDIDAAKNAGVPVVAVDFGYTAVPVSQLGPDRVISHFDALWDAVQSLPARAA